MVYEGATKESDHVMVELRVEVANDDGKLEMVLNFPPGARSVWLVRAAPWGKLYLNRTPDDVGDAAREAYVYAEAVNTTPVAPGMPSIGRMGRRKKKRVG